MCYNPQHLYIKVMKAKSYSVHIDDEITSPDNRNCTPDSWPHAKLCLENSL